MTDQELFEKQAEVLATFLDLLVQVRPRPPEPSRTPSEEQLEERMAQSGVFP